MISKINIYKSNILVKLSLSSEKTMERDKNRKIKERDRESDKPKRLNDQKCSNRLGCSATKWVETRKKNTKKNNDWNCCSVKALVSCVMWIITKWRLLIDVVLVGIRNV